MSTFPFFLIAAALLLVLGILAAGLVNLFRGGSPRLSNKLMQYRVIAQFGLLALIALLALIYHK